MHLKRPARSFIYWRLNFHETLKVTSACKLVDEYRLFEGILGLVVLALGNVFALFLMNLVFDGGDAVYPPSANHGVPAPRLPLLSP